MNERLAGFCNDCSTDNKPTLLYLQPYQDLSAVRMARRIDYPGRRHQSSLQQPAKSSLSTQLQ